MSASYGLRSHHPEEACTHHYFSTTTTTTSTTITTTLLVAETVSSPCPFSGSYTVQGRLLLQGVKDVEQGEEEEEEGCQTVMQVRSNDLNVRFPVAPEDMVLSKFFLAISNQILHPIHLFTQSNYPQNPIQLSTQSNPIIHPIQFFTQSRPAVTTLTDLSFSVSVRQSPSQEVSSV